MTLFPNNKTLHFTKALNRIFPFFLFVLSAFFLTFSGCKEEPNTPSLQRQDLDKALPYANYSFSQDNRVIDLGDQPYWTPAALIIEYMIRDSILKEKLESNGFSLRRHHFLNGSDLNFFLKKGDLEIGVAGDMPALTAAATDYATILSVFKGSVSLVSKDIREIEKLKGKKVGYAFGSNAHLFLLKLLRKSRMDTGDIKLVEMDISRMSKALNDGKIDAYATWEFTPSTTIKIVQDKVTTRKKTSYGFLYIREVFFKDHPEIVHYLLASQVRAVKWLRAKDNHVKLLTYWLYNELNQWDQKETPLSLKRLLAHVKEGVAINEYSGPRIPIDLLEENGILKDKFIFLKEHGFLPKDTQYKTMRGNIKNDYIDHVLANPKEYQTKGFAYLSREN